MLGFNLLRWPQLCPVEGSKLSPVVLAEGLRHSARERSHVRRPHLCLVCELRSAEALIGCWQ